MTDDSTPSKAQLRWRRNKRDQRDRARIKPQQLSPEFLARVKEERDKRASWDAFKWSREQPELNFWSSKSRHLWVRKRYGDWFDVVADIWAATVEIEAALGSGKATPTRIAKHLEAKRCWSDYTFNSARVMVYRARFTIAALEQAAMNDPDAQYWLPFKP